MHRDFLPLPAHVDEDHRWEFEAHDFYFNLTRFGQGRANEYEFWCGIDINGVIRYAMTNGANDVEFAQAIAALPGADLAAARAGVEVELIHIVAYTTRKVVTSGLPLPPTSSVWALLRLDRVF